MAAARNYQQAVDNIKRMILENTEEQYTPTVSGKFSIWSDNRWL